MSAETPGTLPGPHGDRLGDGSIGPAGWDAVRERDARAARAYYGDVVVLPGYGTQPNRCVRRKPVGFCDLEGHVTLASASPCASRPCPEHWSLWQREAVTKFVARCAAYRHVQEGAQKRMLHVVDSPDPDRRWTAEAFWEERSASYDVVSEVGGRGGVTIPHPYRSSEAGDWLFESVVEEGDWDEEWGMWSLFRREADDWEEMGEFIESSPHYHHLVAAEDFDPDAIPERRTVKNIRSLEQFHIRDLTGYRDIARLGMYLLSHAALQIGADRNTITYWGDLHPNCFDPLEELTATEWDTIQRMAERAVTSRPSDDLARDAGEHGPTPCPQAGCQGQVVPIDELRNWLSRGEWVGALERRERRILKGVVVWLEHQADRPPPSSSRQSIRDRLYQWGRERERTRQSGLKSFT